MKGHILTLDAMDIARGQTPSFVGLGDDLGVEAMPNDSQFPWESELGAGVCVFVQSEKRGASAPKPPAPVGLSSKQQQRP